MAQHFLLSAAARSLSPGKVMRMSERGAENVFVRLRWPQTDGKPVCPRCGWGGPYADNAATTLGSPSGKGPIGGHCWHLPWFAGRSRGRPDQAGGRVLAGGLAWRSGTISAL
jgi:hypothetical protein